MYRRTVVMMSGLAAITPRVAVAAPNAAVVLTTAFGPIRVAIFASNAPLSARAFLACVDAGAYQGGHFTRVVRPNNDRGFPKIQVVQAAARPGAPVGPAIAHETTALTGLRHLDGTISLPRDAPGTATGGEFFICVGDQPGLDYGGQRNKDGQGFAAFGRVISGMEIVRRIQSQDASGASTEIFTRDQMLLDPVPILHAQRVTAKNLGELKFPSND